MLSAARTYLIAILWGVCAILSSPQSASAQTAPGVPGAHPLADALSLYDANLARGATPVPGHLILPRYAQKPRADRLERAIGAHNCHTIKDLGYAPFLLVDCGEAADTRALIARFATDGIWAEADFYEQQDEGIQDPTAAYDLSDAQWHHGNRGQVIDEQEGIPGADIRSTLAWQITAGASEAPTIAVIDAGLDPHHPDFQDLFFQNLNEVCGNGVDDDNNGYVDDCHGWDIGDDDPDPNPATLPEMKESGSTCKSWHGNFMAGIAAARGDNGVGTSGVSWGGKLINLKKHDDAACSSSTSDSIEAVAYAHAMGAKIMLLSFSTRAYSKNFFDTLIAGERDGVLFVMSAGNDGEDIDGQERFPAAYPLPNGIVVANSNNRDALSGTSNWGGDLVDIAAPGTDLFGPEPGGEWGQHSGTSYAGPLVGGVAALVWATYPRMSTRQVRQAILQGSKPLAALDCDVTEQCVASGGRLDAFGALDAAATITGEARILVEELSIHEQNMDGKLTPGERVSIGWTLSNGGAASGALTASVQIVEQDAPLVPLQNDVALPPLAFGERITSGDGSEILFAVDEACQRDTMVSASLLISDAQGGLWARDLILSLDCEVDLDLDGFARPIDCDDGNAEVSPMATEVCDEVDNDCDGLTDEPEAEDARYFYVDEDGDGAGNPDLLTLACRLPPGDFVLEGDDCDDSDPEVGPYEGEDGEDACGLLPEIAAKRAGSPQAPGLLCAIGSLSGGSGDKGPLVICLGVLLFGWSRRRERT